jgi:kynurenine formamidase
LDSTFGADVVIVCSGWQSAVKPKAMLFEKNNAYRDHTNCLVEKNTRRVSITNMIVKRENASCRVHQMLGWAAACVLQQYCQQ